MTLVAAMMVQPGFDTSNATPGLLLCVGPCTVTGSNVTFHLFENAAPGVIDVTTEFPDATPLPSLGSPLGILVDFYETPGI